MGQGPSRSCSLLWAGALFHASSAEIAVLYLVQDYVCKGVSSILGEGIHPVTLGRGPFS